MKRIVVAWVSCVLSAVDAATQASPAPGGETGGFTAAEAYAFACCQRIAGAWRQGDAVELRNWVPLPGYCGVSTARSDGTPLRFDEKQALSGIRRQLPAGPSLMVDGGDVLLYVVPEQAAAATRRVFCVRGDGVIAFTDNTAGTAMNGAREPEPADVLGDGAEESLAAFPRTPGRGRDGNMWMPGDLVKQATARVMLVDENGVPHATTVIAAVPADAEEELDVAIPAGVGRTLREGDATWTGVPARGMALEVRMQGAKLRVAKSAVTATGSSLRAVVKRADLRRLGSSRNEAAAIATLKNISSAQSQCQACCAIDANQNGAGEYGMFAELAGRDVVRGGKQKITPPVLSTAFSRVEDGVVVRSGYCFRMFLPGKDGAAVAEFDRGGVDAASIDAGAAEVTWCLYAWPVEPGVSGERAFFIDQAGDVLAASNDDGRYAGKAKAPPANAARTAGSAGRLDSACAANRQGLDGQVWRIVP